MNLLIVPRKLRTFGRNRNSSAISHGNFKINVKMNDLN